MRLRRRLWFLLAALLGAAVVVLPAVASSETNPTPTVNAIAESGIYAQPPHWSPELSTIVPGQTVTFVNSSTVVPHGVVWTSSVTPVCEASVPVGKGNFKANWSGACTFAQSGEYTFYCSYHGPSMHGTITVNANGTTATTSTEPPSPGGTSTAGTPTTAPGSETTGGQRGSTGSPLAGSASSAVKLLAVQHGESVHGSVAISQAGAGGRLEVDLLAKGGSLARLHHAQLVPVGRLVRSSLRAGTVSFAVALNAKAKHALTVHRRLALTVKILLRSLHGSAVTVARSVVVHS